MKTRHILLFIFVVLLLFGLLSWFFSERKLQIGDVHFRWPGLEALISDTIADESDTTIVHPIAIDTTICVSEQDTVVSDTVAVISTPDTATAIPLPEKPTVTVAIPDTQEIDILPYDTSSPDWIAPFRNALTQADSVPIRVVHYGDSQLEGDRMSINLRRRLQATYGGGGVGLIPLHQTISTRTLHQSLTMNGEVQTTNGGPKRYLAYGPKNWRRNTACYGPMAQVALMNDSLCHGSEHLTLSISPMSNTKYSERYFNRVRVLCTEHITPTISGAIPLGNNLFQVQDSSTRCTIHLEGQGDVYGLSIEQNNGVTVDNIPMRGCAGTIFTSIHSAEMKDYFRAVNARLIILQYGGNVVPYTKDTVKMNVYVSNLRAQVQYIKRCAPYAAILFIGPSDMLTSVNGQRMTYPIIPKLDAAIRQMTEEEQIGYWSLYHAMGGRGSMSRWQQNGWAGSDGVHFTRKGADKAGEMLADFIIQQLNRPLPQL